MSERYSQRLLVSISQVFSEEENGLFEYIYEKYTGNFGTKVSEPNITTKCEVTRQTISEEPINQTGVYAMSTRFTMSYHTDLPQYNISDYPLLFRRYVNKDTDKVRDDMVLLGLPVVEVEEVIMVCGTTF